MKAWKYPVDTLGFILFGWWIGLIFVVIELTVKLLKALVDAIGRSAAKFRWWRL